MTLDKANTDKLAEFCNEARRLEIKVLPPSVQTSGADFEPADCNGEPAIRYALSAIKGVGETQARGLASVNGSGEMARSSKPAFRDLTDFAAKLNPREINKRMLESLAASGAFDDLDPNRARIVAGAEAILAAAQRREDEQLAGQSALFGGETLDAIVLPKVEPWPLAERLRREFEIGRVLSVRASARCLCRDPRAATGAALRRVRRRGQAGRVRRAARRDSAGPARTPDQVGREDGDRYLFGSIRPI